LPVLMTRVYTPAMANNEHLSKLAESIETWNAWRQEQPDIRPDLSSVNFRGADLGGVNFSDANLSDAKLRDVNLKEANLKKADLREADLSGADLTRAELGGAYLYRADLIGTRLIGANLNEANIIDATLIGADLRGADLSSADIRQANLMNADLSDVTGLECESLQRASNWQLATRTPELDCGEPRRPQDDEATAKMVSTQNPAAEPTSEPRYRIRLGPGGRPAMEIDPNRTRLRRPEVTRDQQLAAAADLEDSIKGLVTTVRAALKGFAAVERQTSNGDEIQPPGIDEINEQILADAKTLIQQSRAPAPNLIVFHHFKTLVRDLDPITKTAAAEDGPTITAILIGKINFFLKQFGP
jgi:hypothetical protein